MSFKMMKWCLVAFFKETALCFKKTEQKKIHNSEELVQCLLISMLPETLTFLLQYCQCHPGVILP